MGPRVGLNGCGKFSPPPGFDPVTLQLVASQIHFIYIYIKRRNAVLFKDLRFPLTRTCVCERVRVFYPHSYDGN